MRTFTVAKIVLLSALLTDARDVAAADLTIQQKLQTDREHYDKQLRAYREMRDKVERGHVSETQWQAAQDMEDFGMNTLKELSFLSAARDITKAVNLDKLSVVPWRANLPYVLYVAEAAEKAYKAEIDLEKRRAEGRAADPEYARSYQAKLDEAIAVVEHLKRPAQLVQRKEWAYGDEKKMDCLTGTTLSALYALKAATAEGKDERMRWGIKAGREVSETLLKFPTLNTTSPTTLGGVLNAQTNRSGVLALDKVLAETSARLMVSAVAISWSDSMQAEALLRKENTLSDLNYRIMVADYERDKVLAAERKLARGLPPKEPGGIKFNSQRADELALKLDIDSVAYDPVRGRLVVSGKKSEEAFDMDIFADVLRLAVEEHEPFFSMDPSRIEDWDFKSIRMAEKLREKYKTEELTARVRSLCAQPIQRGSRSYYYTTAYELDAGLFAAANEGRDISEKLVFSPNWLRYSKVGWILYEADMAIKAVAAGFQERWPDVIPSAAWELPDFNPKWLNRREHGHAGRANFELDEASVVDANGRLSLAEIRPKLYVTFREPGTNEDVTPQPPECKAISDHFTRNWRFYVERVPEINRLQHVYKAYVAAKYLVHEHPGLAERIRSLPRHADWPEQPPLRVIRPNVIRVCYEGERLVPLDDEQRVWWDIGGGYGGGAVFKVGEKVDYTAHTAAPAAWTGAALLDAASTLDFEEHGDHAALAFEIGTAPMPGEPMLRTGFFVAGILLGAALLGAALRRWDWQQIVASQVCRHCEKVYAGVGKVALLGHALTAAGLFCLLVLPLLAASREGEVPWTRLVVAVLVLTGVAALLTLTGSLIFACIRRVRPAMPGHRGWVPEFFVGGQLCGFFMLVALWQGGVSATAIGMSCRRLLGSALGERLLVQFGGATPLAWAAWALAAGLLIVLLSRWVVPLMLGSRPLLFSSSQSHHHSS